MNDSIKKERMLNFNKKGRFCKEAVAIHPKDNKLIEKEKFFQGSDESKLGIPYKSSNFKEIKEIDIKQTWNDFNIKRDKKSDFE